MELALSSPGVVTSLSTLSPLSPSSLHERQSKGLASVAPQLRNYDRAFPLSIYRGKTYNSEGLKVRRREQCRSHAEEPKGAGLKPRAMAAKEDTATPTPPPPHDSDEEKARGEVKLRVIRAVANTERGKATTVSQRQQILKLIEELEGTNPTVNPALSPLVNGRWSLLYTGPTNEETADKFAGSEEGPFLSRVKPLAFGAVRQKASTQIIDVDSGCILNIADFSVFGVPGSLTIRASGSLAPPVPGRGSIRLDVTFESFVLQVNSLKPVTIPLTWISPKGWVDTTYVDEDVRVGRGDKGSIFVAARLK